MMTLSHIVACSKNHIIGTQGDLPWSLPEDMKFFRDKTKNHIMIMGRKTFDSFAGKPLPHRLHIVITRDPAKVHYEPVVSSPVILVTNLEQALVKAKEHLTNWPQEVFIIGGGEIYQQSMGLVDKIYLTKIDQNFDGDTTYPEVPEKDFELVDKSDRTEPIHFSFLTFLRRR